MPKHSSTPKTGQTGQKRLARYSRVRLYADAAMSTYAANRVTHIHEHDRDRPGIHAQTEGEYADMKIDKVKGGIHCHPPLNPPG